MWEAAAILDTVPSCKTRMKARRQATALVQPVLFVCFFPDTVVRFLGWFWVFWEASCSPVGLLTLQLLFFFLNNHGCLDPRGRVGSKDRAVHVQG